MADNKVYLYSKNTSFSGKRNLGHHGVKFFEGVAEATEKDAKIYCAHFPGGYFCPEIFPEHGEIVENMRGKDEERGANGDGSLDKSEEQQDGKVDIVYIERHTIGIKVFEPGAESRVKKDFADKLIAKGKARLAETESDE